MTTTTTDPTLHPTSPAIRSVAVVGKAMAGCIAPWLLLAPPRPSRPEGRARAEERAR